MNFIEQNIVVKRKNGFRSLRKIYLIKWYLCDKSPITYKLILSWAQLAITFKKAKILK